eukprot:2724169-Rhodomonas_salina.2
MLLRGRFVLRGSACGYQAEGNVPAAVRQGRERASPATGRLPELPTRGFCTDAAKVGTDAARVGTDAARVGTDAARVCTDDERGTVSPQAEDGWTALFWAAGAGLDEECRAMVEVNAPF